MTNKTHSCARSIVKVPYQSHQTARMYKPFITAYHSSSSIFITNKAHSSGINHHKSTEPESPNSQNVLLSSSNWQHKAGMRSLKTDQYTTSYISFLMIYVKKWCMQSSLLWFPTFCCSVSLHHVCFLLLVYSY